MAHQLRKLAAQSGLGQIDENDSEKGNHRSDRQFDTASDNHEALANLTQIDYDREMAFIAVVQQESKDVEIGVARYVMNPDRHSCEFALVVADQWQKKGIGSYLMTQLMQAAKNRGFDIMVGEVLADNDHMLDLAARLGFIQHAHDEDPGIAVVSKYL